MRRKTLLLVSLLALASATACRPPTDTTPPGPGQGEQNTATATPSDPATILANSALPATIDTPLPNDAAQVSIHRLQNGMTVYLSPSDEAPNFNAWIAVRTGSRNDPANSTGLAHYLEHMLFKGTDELGTLNFSEEKAHLEAIAKLYDQLREATDEQARNQIFAQIDAATQATAKTAIPNELDQLYDAMGVTGLNAFTSVDQTVYIGKIPANRLDAWARVEAERFQDAQFRLFYPELEAVYEEKNISMDNPQRRAHEEMNRALFPSHPYGTQTTIGTVEHLKTPAYGDMKRYFDAWYAPNNMAIILAGNFDRQAALTSLEKYFGAWQPKALPKPAPASLTPIKSRKFVEVQGPGHPSVMIAWPTVRAGHQDQIALEVLDSLIQDKNGGLLGEKLLLTQILPNAGAYLNTMHEAGYWALIGHAGEGQSLQKVEQLLLSLVDDLRRGNFNQEHLDAVKLNLEIQHKKMMESSGSRVSAIASSYWLREDWAQQVAWLDKVRQVKKEDILRVAELYLGPGHVVVHQKRGTFSPPKINKPTITPVAIDPTRRSPFFNSVLAMPATPIEPKWARPDQDFKYLPQKQSGVAVQNPTNDLFSLSFSYPVGSESSPLLCHALSLGQLSGTKTTPAKDLQKKLYALGTSVRLVCGEYESNILISGIDRNLEPSVAIVKDWLNNLEIPEEQVKQYASNEIAKRRTNVKHPRALSMALFSYAARGKQSPFVKEISNAKLAKTRASKLEREVDKMLDRSFDLLYFGPRQASALPADLRLGKGKKKAKKRKALRYSRAKKNEVYVIDQPMAQALIGIHWTMPPGDLKQRALAEIANAYLGGMGGLLFQELREARGLAYSVGARLRQGSYKGDDGQVRANIGTQADKTPEAIRILLEQLQKPVQPVRLQVAKEALMQRFRTDHITPRSMAGRLWSWKRAGYEEDPRPQIMQHAQAINAEELSAYLKTLLSKPARIAIVGPKARLDLPSLEKFGKIKELKADDVFGFGAFPPPTGPQARG